MGALRCIGVLLLVLPIAVGCGVKRPLIAPKDIPAHQEKLRKKQERFKADEATGSDIAAPDGGDK